MVVAFLLFACKSKKTEQQKAEPDFEYGQFSQMFRIASLPYQLTDTSLLYNKDTAIIRGTAFSDLIPDSIQTKVFGKGVRVKYVPLAKIENPKKETYFIVKGEGKGHKAALLLSFDKAHQFGATLPFLLPDDDATTTQVSTIDKAFSVSRSVLRKQPNDVIAEGKDVYVYSNDTRQFTLIMTDLLDDKNVELINPIDTLPKLQKQAGDYIKDKKNIVSIRDGRKPNLLTVFVHIEKGNNDCSGELKGDAEIISPTTAVYRQAGDPCVLQFSFGASSVTLKEIEGCGSHRGLECAFNGTFPRKKEPKIKTSKKNKRS